MVKVLVSTRNKKKLEEIKRILDDDRIDLLELGGFKGLPDIIEDADTFRGNAIKKALVIARRARMLTMADDSGLEVDILGGRPGVFSARFAGGNKKDFDNNIKLLRLLKGIPLKDRKARFVCNIAIADKSGLVDAIEGHCCGYIGFKMQGRHGFGYDPVFIVPKYKKTFAQLGAKIKDKISHRAIALRKAKKIILTAYAKY